MINPSDPEATYREKSGKVHRGYVANLEETVGVNGSVVTDYEYEPNVYSDPKFLKDRLDELPKQEAPTLLVTDGGYFSNENTEAASEKNIQLVTTDLTGMDAKAVLNEFEYNEELTKVLHCPAGHEPRSSCFVTSDQRIKSSFDKDQCEKCPYREQCNPQIKKRTAQVFIYRKSIIRAQLQKRIASEEFRVYAKLRNGIETIPSTIRRNYHLEKLPRGKQRGKFFFGNKIAALNFRKLFCYRRALGNYARNPLLA